MALFQTGTGYRDPNKAMTIKALQERQKLAAASMEQASAMPQQIASPWQGAAYLGNILGSGVQQGRADAAEADARDRLSQIIAGVDPVKGMTPQQYAQARSLDPEMADRQYEAAMAERRADENRRETQAFTTSEREAGNVFTAGQQEDTQAFTAGQQEDTQAATAAENDLNRKADVARQKQADAEAAGRQEDAQAAAQELARINAQLDQTKADAEAAGKVTAIGTEGKAREAEADRLGIPPGPQRDEFILTGDISKVGNTYINGEQNAFDKTSGTKAAERLDSYIAEGQNSKDFISQVRMVADLGKSVGTGKWAQAWAAAGPYIEMMGIDVTGLGESQAYQAITNKMAPAMRPAGSGATSNFDAQQFLGSLQRLGNDPKGNEIIEFTFEALAKNKMDAAEIASKVYSGEVNPATQQAWKWHEAEAAIRALPNPYDTFKQYMGGTATPPAATDDGTTPPPATDAGGGTAPAFDPQQDEEGDTGTDEQGNKWIVRGNQWVPQ